MGEAIGPAAGARIVAIGADPEVKCVVLSVLDYRVIGVNDAYRGTDLWDEAERHAGRHLARGIDVFTICDVDCPC